MVAPARIFDTKARSLLPLSIKASFADPYMVYLEDPTLATGTYPITISGVVGSDGGGINVPTTGTGGSLALTANQAPVVTIGANQTITLPANAALTATATDDGSPNPPGMLTYSWSEL